MFAARHFVINSIHVVLYNCLINLSKKSQVLVIHISTIPRNALLDAMKDDDDIEWLEDPFDRPQRAEPESPDELLAMIQFEGTPALQGARRSLCRDFIDIFSTAVRLLPARVKPMVIEVDRAKWELPSNRLPQRHHSAEKQAAIRTQVDALLN